MQGFWKDKKVFVSGGNGFIGSHVIGLLSKYKAHVFTSSLDLRNEGNATKVTKSMDIVLHLASKVAGIQYNIDHPVEMFEDNVIMTKNILSAARVNKVERVLIVSSACVYPQSASIPTPESEGFKDSPEPTNLGYGWSKRVIEVMARLYHQEYGLQIAIARPSNTYGPRDNFNDATSHVIPGIIKRVLQGEDPLIVWGSGNQTRSFIYVEDLADGLLQLTQKYPTCNPINLGSSEEVSIKKLAQIIIRLTGKKTRIIFDPSKPDGQPRRLSDVNNAQNLLEFKSQTTLVAGLKKTITWYKQHLSSSPEMKLKELKK